MYVLAMPALSNQPVMAPNTYIRSNSRPSQATIVAIVTRNVKLMVIIVIN